MARLRLESFESSTRAFAGSQVAPAERQLLGLGGVVPMNVAPDRAVAAMRAVVGIFIVVLPDCPGRLAPGPISKLYLRDVPQSKEKNYEGRTSVRRLFAAWASPPSFAKSRPCQSLGLNPAASRADERTAGVDEGHAPFRPSPRPSDRRPGEKRSARLVRPIASAASE